MSRTAAILLAAGQGRRMREVVADKILAPLAGRPVFAHSAAAFAGQLPICGTGSFRLKLERRTGISSEEISAVTGLRPVTEKA